MAGQIQIDSVTALTASGSNIVLNNVNTATNRTNLGLGSIATQDANAVALTGGTIENATLDSTVTFPAEASPIQKVKTQAISGAVSYSFDSVFSTTYHSYEIVLSSGIWTASTGVLRMRLRTASGDDSSSVYNNRTFTVGGSANGLFEFSSTTNNIWDLTFDGNTTTDGISLHVFIQNPYLATKTIFYSNSRDNIDQSGGSTNSNTQYTGFTIFSNIATNFSGTIHVYGYR